MDKGYKIFGITHPTSYLFVSVAEVVKFNSHKMQAADRIMPLQAPQQ
jgi:hypothetical protein